MTYELAKSIIARWLTPEGDVEFIGDTGGGSFYMSAGFYTPDELEALAVYQRHHLTSRYDDMKKSPVVHAPGTPCKPY